jgi:hypothetical protein
MYDFAEVKRVCQESTLIGMKTIYEAGPGKPFRFLYVSGMAAERDQTKKPRLMAEYSLLRVGLSFSFSAVCPSFSRFLFPPRSIPRCRLTWVLSKG